MWFPLLLQEHLAWEIFMSRTSSWLQFNHDDVHLFSLKIFFFPILDINRSRDNRTLMVGFWNDFYLFIFFPFSVPKTNVQEIFLLEFRFPFCLFVPLFRFLLRGERIHVALWWSTEQQLQMEKRSLVPQRYRENV